MQPEETDAYLVIPDVSGYSRFMQLPHTSLEHSQRGISALLESLVSAAGEDLVASKFEGDAVLTFRPLSHTNSAATEERRLVRCVTRMIGAFYETRERLAEDLEPGCRACAELKALDLKIILHRGQILIHEVLARPEISGPAVILAHRLLGVAREQPRRLVVTDQVGIDLEFPFPTRCQSDTASFDGTGDVKFRVFTFDPAAIRQTRTAPS